MVFSLQLITAFLLDLAAGDPRWLYHPVRLIGWWCASLERFARKYLPFMQTEMKGVCVVFAVILGVQGLLMSIFALADTINPNLRVVIAFFLLYTGIAAGDLLRHSRQVASRLKSENLEQARQSVSKLVGRDTKDLDASGISRACIESVSENLVDGVTAPVFWGVTAAVFSVLLGTETLNAAVYGMYLYKSINTMDSMIGYKNDLYIDFGRCAAKTDDIFNLIPARISGLIVVAASAVMKMNYRESWKTFCEDRLKSSSPNSGHTEAAVAGALELQLGGASSYFGKIQYKPLIGADYGAPESGDIIRANRLVLAASTLFVFFALLFFNILRLAFS